MQTNALSYRIIRLTELLTVCFNYSNWLKYRIERDTRYHSLSIHPHPPSPPR